MLVLWIVLLDFVLIVFAVILVQIIVLVIVIDVMLQALWGFAQMWILFAQATVMFVVQEIV